MTLYRTLYFTVGVTLAVAAFSAAPVEAWWARGNATACLQDPATIGIFTPAYDEGEIRNTDGTDELQIMCPIADNSSTPKGSAVSVNFHGYDGNDDAGTSGQIRAQICVAFWDVVGGACGNATASSSTGTGVYSISPDETFWSGGDDADFGFLAVVLPDIDVGTSNFKGWFISN